MPVPSFWELVSLDVQRVREYGPPECRAVCKTSVGSQYRVKVNSPGILFGLRDACSRNVRLSRNVSI
jgi:hypothetical protein